MREAAAGRAVFDQLGKAFLPGFRPLRAGDPVERAPAVAGGAAFPVGPGGFVPAEQRRFPGGQLAELTPDEEALFRKTKDAWSDWKKRPPGYCKTVLGWIAGAKKAETRAKRLEELIRVSADGRRLPQYDWQKKP